MNVICKFTILLQIPSRTTLEVFVFPIATRLRTWLFGSSFKKRRFISKSNEKARFYWVTDKANLNSNDLAWFSTGLLKNASIICPCCCFSTYLSIASLTSLVFMCEDMLNFLFRDEHRTGIAKWMAKSVMWVYFFNQKIFKIFVEEPCVYEDRFFLCKTL